MVDTPVIGVGGIREPKFAEKLIREGMVDFVAVGRELLKDSDWAKKANETLEKCQFQISALGEDCQMHIESIMSGT